MTLQIYFLVSAVVMTTGDGKGDNGREEALKLSRGEVVFGGKGGQERPRRGRKRGGKGKMGKGKKKMGEMFGGYGFYLYFCAVIQ